MVRPIPKPTFETQYFWDGINESELRFQRCNHCRQTQLIPRALCSACQQGDLKWHCSSGKGHVLSYTVVHRAPLPAFKEDTPYIIALIDMEEGFRLMVTVKGGGTTPVQIGQLVQIGFREIQGVILPEAEMLA